MANGAPPLSTAPDALFSTVIFGASGMLACRFALFSAFRHRHSVTWFATGALLARLSDALESLAVSEEHAPRRAAAVIRELRTVWAEKVTAKVLMKERIYPQRVTVDECEWADPAGPHGVVLPVNRQAVPSSASNVAANGIKLNSAAVQPAAPIMTGPPAGVQGPAFLPHQPSTWPEVGIQAALAGGTPFRAFQPKPAETPSSNPFATDLGAIEFAGAPPGSFGSPNPDAFLDDDFWASFMGNLSAPGGGF
jgi:hypothetical protein